MKDNYIIVELHGSGCPGMSVLNEDGEPMTFGSIELAKAYMRNEAKELLDGTEMEFGRMTDWGTPVAICKVVSVCRPVPVVSVRVEIVECDKKQVKGL